MTDRTQKDDTSISNRLLLALLLGIVITFATACADTNLVSIDSGTYAARVPTEDQLAAPGSDGIPRAFATMRGADIGGVQLSVDADQVEFILDGGQTITRDITERTREVAAEAEDVFQSTFEVEVLHLGSDSLVLGPLTIESPVLVPADLEGRPVVAVDSYDPDGGEHEVTCDGPQCLLATTNPPPSGRFVYVDGEEPETTGTVRAVEFSGSSATLTLGSGDEVSVERPETEDGTTLACGLSESPVWEVPAEAGLDMDSPVLVDTRCAWTDGRTVTIMPRSAIPLLAPATGPWCQPGASCLPFSPED